jgi:hypothetical protein
MGIDPGAGRMGGTAWMRSAVARAEVWFAFATSTAAVVATVGATAGIAYAVSWLLPSGAR